MYVVDWGFLRSEFTAYEIRCGLPLVDLEQCSQLPSTGHFATTYKILREQQLVVSHGGSEDIKCEIASRTNWKCTYGFDSTLSFGAKNGVFRETVPEGYRARSFFVPRWKFLLIEMGFIP